MRLPTPYFSLLLLSAYSVITSCFTVAYGNMERHASSPSPSSSSQQLPQIRTDTDTSSAHNNSSNDPATKSLSITATRATVPSNNRTVAQTAATASANVSTSRPFLGVFSDPQRSQGGHSPSHPMSSANFPVSNTSMSFSSVDNGGNARPRSNPRMREGNTNTNNNNASTGGRVSRQSPPQRRNSGDNSVMDAVSRSLNAHNDPELEGLPPMGDESSAEGSTLLYEKGFLISTSRGTDRDTGAGNASGLDNLSAHMHDEEQQQQQQQQQQENSVSDASRSRGPGASASGISHRLLTAEEVEERRRATSRPLSQTASRAVPGMADLNKSMTSSNVSLSASGKPAHRQLSKEETEKLIAQRQQQFREQEKLKQQQRAAAAATAAAAAAATPHSTPPSDSTATASAHRQKTPPQPRMTSATTTKNNNNNTNVSESAPLNANATPWLLAGDDTQASVLHSQTGHPAPSTSAGGGGGVTFEWLHGASAGVGGLMDPNARAWSATSPWRDAAAAAATSSGTNALSSPPFFPGAKMAGGGGGGGDMDFGSGSGDGHNVGGGGSGGGGGLTLANVAAMGGSGSATGGYTWLSNTSYWPTLEQQQQQQQSAVMRSMATMAGATAGSPHDAFAYISGSQTLLSSTGPLGGGGGNSVGTSAAGVARPSGMQFAGPLAGLTLSLLQSLPLGQIEMGIHQCDEQIMRAQQDREVLYHELQRRQYTMTSNNSNLQHNTSSTSIASGGAPGTTATEPMSGWLGTLHSGTAVNTAAATARPASTGSPSRFFNGPGMESGLPHMLDVPTSILRIGGAGLNFSTAASCGTSSMTVNAAAATSGADGAVERRSSGSDVPVEAAAGPLTSKPAAAAATGGWGPNERRSSNNNNNPQSHQTNTNNNSSSTASRGYRHGNRSRGHSSVANKSHHGSSSHSNRAGHHSQHHHNASTSFGASAAAAAAPSGALGGTASTGTRCSHDNTPQEQKYLQTDPFSMYMHNKRIATAAASQAKDTSM